MSDTYRGAGVDIEAGDEAVHRIREHVQSTFRPEVIGDIGGFGGLFRFDVERWREPVLVSTTDGVGTKAMIAQAVGRFDTIGLDLVAMCVDDLVCHGAEPLFFLDYLAVGRLDPEQVEKIVQGVAEGCRQAGCALVGGEMAEHPGAMEPDAFDLVGFAAGVVERSEMITGEHVVPGDVLVGLPSPNLRSNGFSLVRRVLLERDSRALDAPAWEGAHHTLADELLEPSVIYAPAVLRIARELEVHAVAHVTGGGIAGNLARVLPPGTGAMVDRQAWEPPRIFTEVQQAGEIDDAEMERVFNLGIGVVLIVPAGEEHKVIDLARTEGHRALRVGEVIVGDRAVEIVHP
jgi:phosphoribosylformylglycinamidine cyclo-ligase